MEPSSSQLSSGTRRLAAWSLTFAVLTSTALLAIPARIIHPFRAQSPRGIAISYALHHAARLVAPLAALIVVSASVLLWPGARRAWVRRPFLVLASALCLGAAWFAYQLPFEWMFNPLQHAAFAQVREVHWAADTDEVMSLELHGDAVAYPLRQMAYHHIVHDDVGGVPLVVTY